MRLTDNEFHSKENKERACYIQEPRLQAIYDKLFDLEDIEEELGIDLITLFKALRNRVFTINQPPSYFPVRVSLQIGGYGDAITAYLIRRYDNDDGEEVCRLKDYGKTWALTKEELL